MTLSEARKIMIEFRPDDTPGKKEISRVNPEITSWSAWNIVWELLCSRSKIPGAEAYPLPDWLEHRVWQVCNNTTSGKKEEPAAKAPAKPQRKPEPTPIPFEPFKRRFS